MGPEDLALLSQALAISVKEMPGAINTQRGLNMEGIISDPRELPLGATWQSSLHTAVCKYENMFSSFIFGSYLQHNFGILNCGSGLKLA